MLKQATKKVSELLSKTVLKKVCCLWGVSSETPLFLSPHRSLLLFCPHTSRTSFVPPTPHATLVFVSTPHATLVFVSTPHSLLFYLHTSRSSRSSQALPQHDSYLLHTSRHGTKKSRLPRGATCHITRTYD